MYIAMRITGSADPNEKISDTLKGKLPQRVITTTAAAGFSSYGNQIGLLQALSMRFTMRITKPKDWNADM